MLIFWFDFLRVSGNLVGVNLFGVIQVGVIWVDVIHLELNFIIFSLFKTSKIFLRPVFLNRISCPAFSLLSAPCHNALLLQKSNIPVVLKSLITPYPLLCRPLPPMVPCEFILMLSLPPHLIPPLLNSGRLSRLMKEMFLSPFPHLVTS